MTLCHARPCTPLVPRRKARLGRPVRSSETAEATYLRLWVARESARYNDLLRTIAHAPRPR